VDTNTLFQMAAAVERSPLFVAWLASHFTLALSEELLAEFVRISVRPRLNRYLPASRAVRFVALLRAGAMFVDPSVSADMPQCRDIQDNKVIATAIAARADFIVTNDHDLHDPLLAARLHAEYGIRVAWPVEFLAAIRN
jgi:putative PIN family toxin of toxin-antitoxin system